MRKKTKIALKIIGVSVIAIACISAALFWIKRDEQRAPRICLEQLDHAPVDTFILPLRNHEIIYVKCIFKNAGTLNNSVENHGISNVVATLLLKRINGMSTEDTVDKLVELGARSLNVDGSGDDFELSFQVSKEKARDVFTFLNAAFVNPTFSEGDLNKAKDSIPTVLDPETTSAYQLMYSKIFEMMYGTNCAYGLRCTGTAQAIGDVTAEDVKSFIKNKLSRKNLKVLMVGDVTNLTARQYLDVFLKDVADGEVNQAANVEAEALSSSSAFEEITKPNMKKTVGFLAGVRLDRLSSVEKAAVYVIAETLFNSADSDFIRELKKAKIVSNCVCKIIKRSYSYVLLLSSYTDKKDAEKYRKYLDAKIAEYGGTDYCNSPILGKLLETKKYLLKLSDNGFYNVDDIDEQINDAYLPYEEVTQDVLKDMLHKMFGRKGGVQLVICNSDK